MNDGKTLFAQVMEFIPWTSLRELLILMPATLVFVEWVEPSNLV